MNAHAKNLIARPFAMLFALTLALVVAHGSAHAQQRTISSQQQLDQMLAPIALYPDALLSQILMAATYPLEVVEAARWSRSHPNLVGDDAVRAAERENWDPSVKSLLAFPQVLARMDENLQWTQALGDAFLDQEPQVMDTVQNLRRRAQAAGNLRSDERQRIVENGPIVVVQPVNPQFVYVPYYDPMVVYGSWWWPEYRPVYWRPFPGYYARPGYAASFFWGPSIRISAGFFFGAFDWPQRQVRVVHVNYYNNVMVSRRIDVVSRERAPGAWQHDPEHRRGVAYRSEAVQRRFAGRGARPDPQPDAGARVNPRPDRRGEPRSDEGRPVAQPAVQAAVQPAAQPRANSDMRPERRDHGNRIERRPEAPAAGVIPQTRESRGESRREAIRPAAQATVQPAARSAAQAGVQPAAQPRAASPRPGAARATEAQTRTPHAQHEARNEADGQRGARGEDPARRPREQR